MINLFNFLKVSFLLEISSLFLFFFFLNILFVYSLIHFFRQRQGDSSHRCCACALITADHHAKGRRQSGGWTWGIRAQIYLAGRESEHWGERETTESYQRWYLHHPHPYTLRRCNQAWESCQRGIEMEKWPWKWAILPLLLLINDGFMFVTVLCFSVYWMTSRQTISGQGSIFWMQKYHLQILVSFYD